jgi:hypothetical protein
MAGKKMKRVEFSKILFHGHGSEWSDGEHEYELDMFEDNCIVNGPNDVLLKKGNEFKYCTCFCTSML